MLGWGSRMRKCFKRSLVMQCHLHLVAQPWQHICFKPRIGPEPDAIARRWMRQRNESTLAIPGPHPIGQAALLAGELKRHGILPDHQSQRDIRQHRQEPVPPAWRTFAPWWKVTTLALAGITKAHRQAGNQILIIEPVPRQAHPNTQPVTRHIVKWQALRVSKTSRCLTDNQDASILPHLQDRSRTKRQICTEVALANFCNNVCKILSHADQ